jgi:hypothetical protein
VQPLDAVAWADLEHAYGAAVDVPDWIRTLAAGGPDASRAASEFTGALLHQGSCYPATPVAVEYLVDALRHQEAARVEILYLLADAVGGPTISDEDEDEDDDDDEYLYEQATIAAVRAGHALYLALLGHPDPAVRAAATYLIVGCPEAREAARADLLARVTSEPDPIARANQVFALGHLGEGSALAALVNDPDEVVRAAVAIERARFGLTELDELGSLVDAACLEPSNQLWGGVVLGERAAWAVMDLGRSQPAWAEEVLRAAIDRRLATGQRPIGPNELSGGSPTNLTWSRDRTLSALIDAYTPLVFGDLEDRERPATREELTPHQHAVLRWTVDFGLQIPVRAVPWSDPERMRRFLDPPDGPLERPLTVTRAGVAETAPTWFWLCAVDAQSPDGVREALSAQRTPVELVALARDALTYHYAHPLGAARRVALLGELLEPRLSTVEAELRVWAHDLDDSARAEEAAFVIGTLASLARARGEVLDESFDASIAAALQSNELDWLLEVLPAARRTAVLARLRGGYSLRRLLPYGDADEVARRIVSAVATRPADAGIQGIVAGNLLRALGPAAAAPLRAALASGDVADRTLFTDALAELEGRAEHVVAVRATADGLVLRLSTPDGELLAEITTPRHPKHDDLAPLVARLPESRKARLRLRTEPHLDESIEYRLQCLLAEFPVRSVSAGNSTMSVRADGFTLAYGGD